MPTSSSQKSRVASLSETCLHLPCSKSKPNIIATPQCSWAKVRRSFRDTPNIVRNPCWSQLPAQPGAARCSNCATSAAACTSSFVIPNIARPLSPPAFRKSGSASILITKNPTPPVIRWALPRWHPPTLCPRPACWCVELSQNLRKTIRPAVFHRDSPLCRKVVKPPKPSNSPQPTHSTANINFKTWRVYPLQYASLEVELKLRRGLT